MQMSSQSNGKSILSNPVGKGSEKSQERSCGVSLEYLLNKYPDVDDEIVKEIYRNHNRDGEIAEVAILELFPHLLDGEVVNKVEKTAPVSVIETSTKSKKKGNAKKSKNSKKNGNIKVEDDEVVYITQPEMADYEKGSDYLVNKGYSEKSIQKPISPATADTREASPSPENHHSWSYQQYLSIPGKKEADEAETQRLIELFKHEHSQIQGKDITSKDLQKISKVIQNGWENGEVDQGICDDLQNAEDLILLQGFIQSKLEQQARKPPPAPDENLNYLNGEHEENHFPSIHALDSKGRVSTIPIRDPGENGVNNLEYLKKQHMELEKRECPGLLGFRVNESNGSHVQTTYSSQPLAKWNKYEANLFVQGGVALKLF